MNKGNYSVYAMLLAIVLTGCNFQQAEMEEYSGELIKGDLYFKLISAGSLYGADARQVASFRQMMDSLSSLENPSESEVNLMEGFEQLEQWGLLYSPYFHLRTEDGEIHKVYIGEEEYARIRSYDQTELRNENMKVSMTLRGEFLNEYIIRADNLMEIEKVMGTTHWRK